ncbi:MAG: hypothetical protein EBZ77_03275, partial [Chitinophagia bacterium]|nr:hypothetical protein [Chitinophagia bacterium]
TPAATRAPGGVVVGGWSEWSEWRDTTEEITSIGAAVRAFLEPKRKFASFVVRQYREQMGSSGTNYIVRVQADDFDISFDVFKSPTGATQIKTTTGVFPLRRGVCPPQCTQQSGGRRRRAGSNVPTKAPCGKYINGFGLCGDATDWGPEFLQNENLGPFVDCTPCA